MGASIDKMTLYHNKFGRKRTEAMIPHMIEVGKGEGINFSYGGKVGNTLNSHRLIDYAKRHGKEEEMLLKLYSYYFENERDISDIPTLVAAADELGIPNAKQFLESNELLNETRERAESNRTQHAINGVPFFTIDGHPISGAQEPDFLLGVFRRLGFA